ncbi:MAG: phage portal protein [Stackebrandtia sp.]
MPLPEGGAVRWPPHDLDPVNAQIATWSAWYSSDLDQLAEAYTGTGRHNEQRSAWSSVVGYIRSTLRRWFHGPNGSSPRPRQRVHTPLAADIAAASAGLLFSEPPVVSAPLGNNESPDETVQARIDALVDDGTHATWQEAAEVAAALGGVYLRVVWDASVADKPWLSAVHPDAAVPEWRSGKLFAVTLWRTIHIDGQRVVRHLERHEPGYIRHAVYEGTKTELGYPAALTDYPDTQGLADAITDDGDAIATGTDRLTCVYVPNLLPNRIWRHLPVAANLGVADIAGLESMLDFLDMTWSSWAKAVEQGQPRLIVPASYLRNLGAGQGSEFDMSAELFQGVSALEQEGGLQVEQVQFTIPVAELQATIEQLKRNITNSAGYSGRSFGIDETLKQATATEVNSLDRKDLITRDRKICYWGPALADVLEALCGVDAHLFGGYAVRPVIDWSDGVSVDPEAQARTLRELESAGAISTETKVRELHPTWADDQIAAEVQRIRDDNGAATADPVAFTRSLAADEPEAFTDQ